LVCHATASTGTLLPDFRCMEMAGFHTPLSKYTVLNKNRNAADRQLAQPLRFNPTISRDTP
jgi:hypothetical protein